MILASRQHLYQLGAKRFRAVNLNRTAKKLLEPEIEFLLIRLASRQPHVQKILVVNLENG